MLYPVDTDKIRKWFEDHDGDGEFILSPETEPYFVDSPDPSTGCLVYATKRQSVLGQLAQSGVSAPFALIARSGLPPNEHVDWVREIADNRSIAFLGDCDPPDLLTFAYLRSQLPMEYVGVGDAHLAKLRIQLQQWMTIELSDSESHAMTLLHEVFPDFADLVGPTCAALLQSGRKLEIEALISLTERDGQSTVESFLS